ncbi:Fe(3+)-hydroxamate ABC transporter permease FhuB [Moritella dasanensis]|uniref:Fe(3+)-hydroxamate ABC transporter permease FhuB n=1 Tax=Moritella dasanensis TaxID=428031 RepID=UPI000474EC6D|nr:Fe(3+)-hydroxamate ABC transporter permease FhuB [Moritella dasanensis]
MLRYLMTALALMLALFLSLQLQTDMTITKQYALIAGLEPLEFVEVDFVYAVLPRLVVAMLVGASLGLVGSLMQQLTQNPLLSPLTFGTSSGAWLALVLAAVFFPDLGVESNTMFALVGALSAMALVLFITGINNLSGLPVILAGMAVNLLLGAFATAVILLNDQYAKNLFIWGAGDLAQNGWDWVQWLTPRMCVGFVILAVAPRVLTLMRIGQQGATARGLSIMPQFLLLLLLGVWLVSSAITAVGVIGFVGLLTPNIARYLGARTARDELFYSLLLGALFLVLTDAFAVWLSKFTLDFIPSGTAAAVIGAPALIWFSRSAVKAQDQMVFRLPQGISYLKKRVITAILVGLISSILLASLFVMKESSWLFSWPDAFSWSIRWPRILTSLAAGAGLAVAGTILQRLIHNPLASPDILGISAGAIFALVFASMFWGITIFEAGPLVAFSGAMGALLIILLLGKKHDYSPPKLILTGIALTALIEAFVQFALARGNDDVYGILVWLAGSTYRVSAEQSVTLAFSVTLLLLVAFSLSRWLTLISAGRDMAFSRGLNGSVAFVLLLCLVALLVAFVTANMGPVAFIGLLAPHMAAMLGAKSVKQQLIVSALIGGFLVQFSDWLGQVVLYPAQLAAGILVSIIGGSYFILLLIKGRVSNYN